jgi:hypothetical protein
MTVFISVEATKPYSNKDDIGGQNALMMEAARTSEMLINFYQTTRRYNPEDSHLHSTNCPLLPLFFETPNRNATVWPANICCCHSGIFSII